MKRNRNLRSTVRQAKKTTLLIVGEGPADQAFLKHLHQQFRDTDSALRPKIEKQSGGSPGNMLSNAIRKYRNDDYDHRFLVLDSDVVISQQDRDKARQKGYQILLWSPVCLEGALLDLLGEKIGAQETAQQLKARLHPRLSGKASEQRAYQLLFTKEVLEAASNDSINQLRGILTGGTACIHKD